MAEGGEDNASGGRRNLANLVQVGNEAKQVPGCNCDGGRLVAIRAFAVCKVCLTEFPFAGKLVAQSLPTKGNSMSEQQMIEAVSGKIMERSAECQRGIVGDRTLNGIPIAAYVRVAPDCLLYVQPLGDDFVIELCLN